jgi:hypothetical protein
MEAQRIAIVVSISLLVFCGGILTYAFFTSDASSEQVPTLEPISAPEPTEAPPDETSWTVLGLVTYSLITIFILLSMESLTRHLYEWVWRREDETEREMTKLRELLHENIQLVSEWKAMLALFQDEKQKMLSQFIKEDQSIKKAMRMEEKRYAEFQEDMNLTKNLIRDQSQKYAQFQNTMDSLTNTMKMENKNHTRFRDEIRSMTLAKKGTS